MISNFIESLPDALLVVSRNGIIFKVNSLTEIMFGYTSAEMEGQPVEMLMPERYRHTHQHYRDDYLESPRVRPMNEGTGFFGLHKQGHKFAIEIYLSPLQNNNNEWSLAAVRDIRTRKKLEDNLRQSRDELEQRVKSRTLELSQTNEALHKEMQHREKIVKQTQQLNAELAHVSRLSILGEMTSGLAHELNQPLAAISNYSQGCVRRLRNNQTDVKSLIPALERVTSEATRAAEIISRFRNFSRKGALQKQKISTRNLVLTAIDLERFEADAHGIDIQVEFHEQLPDVFVDEIQIQQVMVNLLRNAIEIMSDSNSTVRTIFVLVTLNSSQETVIAIKDHGGGFSTTAGKKFFEPFFTTKPQGLGMGLSISRSIIEAHGGRLWAESDDDRGATFYISLPVNQNQFAPTINGIFSIRKKI